MFSSRSFRSGSAAMFIGLAAVAALSSGCGSEDSAAPAEVRTVTVEATTSPAPAPVVPSAAVPVPAAPEVTPTSAPEPAYMPAVVCVNLQAAQNLIQEAGVFFSRSTDASGADRMQVNDSNWVVVDQDPSAGTLVGEGEAVLSVVKSDEPNNC